MMVMRMMVVMMEWRRRMMKRRGGRGGGVHVFEEMASFGAGGALFLLSRLELAQVGWQWQRQHLLLVDGQQLRAEPADAICTRRVLRLLLLAHTTHTSED
jgi:hypothetical protein